MDATQEQWRPVLGYEGYYEVSDQGHVRTPDTVRTLSNGSVRRYKSRICRQNVKEYGHLSVRLYYPGSPGRNKLVHRLVLEAFVGPCPEGMQACHNDGDSTNNRLHNLRWDTPLENNLDKIRHGVHHYKNRTRCSKGHEYTPETTLIIENARFCRICARERQAAYRRRKKEQL